MSDVVLNAGACHSPSLAQRQASSASVPKVLRVFLWGPAFELRLNKQPAAMTPHDAFIRSHAHPFCFTVIGSIRDVDLEGSFFFTGVFKVRPSSYFL